jgi:anaerobic ribonucleoside-triphosphate reductase
LCTHLYNDKKLCSFQHKKNEVSVNESNGNFDRTDGEKEADDEIVDENVDENVQDDENYDLYVEHNFPDVHERIISGKGQINCYFCDYISKNKTIMKIQEEVNNHLKTYHSEIVDSYDPDSFVSESDYHQDFLDFFVLEY